MLSDRLALHLPLFVNLMHILVVFSADISISLLAVAGSRVVSHRLVSLLLAARVNPAAITLPASHPSNETITPHFAFVF